MSDLHNTLAMADGTVKDVISKVNEGIRDKELVPKIKPLSVTWA